MPVLSEGLGDDYHRRVEEAFANLLDLARHYASILNDLDDGNRVVPKTMEDYMERLGLNNPQAHIEPRNEKQ